MFTACGIMHRRCCSIIDDVSKYVSKNFSGPLATFSTPKESFYRFLGEIRDFFCSKASGTYSMVIVDFSHSLGQPEPIIYPQLILIPWLRFLAKGKLKCTLLQTMRLCTGRTAHRGSRGIALLFLDHGTGRG